MTYLLFVAPHFHHEVGDAKVLQSLPVSDVLKLGIRHRQTQHGRMGFKNLTGNLWGKQLGKGRQLRINRAVT